MKKSILMWCAALICVQGLSGCQCLTTGKCDADGACQASTAFFQKTWNTITRPDLASKSAIQSEKKESIQKASRVLAKDERQDVKTADGLQESHAISKAPLRTLAKTKKLPVITSQPSVAKAAPPIATIAQTSDGAPTLISAEETKSVPPPPAPGDAKSGTVVLKSTYIKYGAADGHKTLVGRVSEWRQTLRLRYAAVEQADIHGGAVTLEGAAELRQLRDGQHVRVRGTLIPASNRNDSARFRVDSVEVID
jgi:hypothetical protein